MRACPTCRRDLVLVNYEGFRILHCESCGGHLLSSSVRRAIEKMAVLTRSELAGEALARYRGSRTGQIACPRCFRTMDRRSLCLQRVTADFDLCRDCDLIWFDGGELALAQLDYESSPAFLDAQEMRSRTKELESDPERLAKFQEALSRMPSLPSNDADFSLESATTMLSDLETPVLLEILTSFLSHRLRP